MARASEGAEGAAFARTLSALKEQGSNLLVVGTTLQRGHVAVCERLLGEPSEQRRRLLVRLDGDCGAAPCEEEASTRVVTRRRPGFEAPEPLSDADGRQEVRGDIDALERAVVEEFAELEAAVDDPEPGELRLCVDSLRPLLVEYPDERVKRFVDQLAARVSRADGMGHFHLPTRSSDKYVSMLTPVVDAVVEVRTEGGHAEQRWHVFDGAVDSGWLQL